MRKRSKAFYLILGCVLTLQYNLLSQTEESKPIKVTGDSLYYLTAQDTIFLSIDFYGEKVFDHFLAKGQTLYSLARFYGMQPEELLFYNPQIDPLNISIGDKIKIPIPNRAIVRKPNRLRNPQASLPIIHKIKRGETLFRLSKMYYRIPIDTIKNWNNMTSDVLAKDHQLYVGWMNVEGIPDSLRKNYGGYWWKRSFELGAQFRGQGGGKKKLRKEKGAAFWQKKARGNSDELFALHRTAKIGSVIMLLNPMTRRTVFVKVLGRIPSAKYQDSVKVVVSEQTAKLLGARDPRFFVEVQYWR